MKRLSFILLSLLLFCVQAFAEDATYINEKYGFSITYPSNRRIIKNYSDILLSIFLPSTSFFDRTFVNITAKSTAVSDRSPEEIADIYFKYSKSVQERKYITINGTKFLSVVWLRRIFFLNLKQYLLITSKGTKTYIMSYTATINNYDKHINEAKEIMHSFRFK